MSNQRFPRMFGKYALLRPFARGGMGEIYLAAHGDLGGAEKLCLVKKVPEDRDAPGLTARLLDEAKVAVRLNHTNVVQVFDAGRVDDELYVAMELIEGRDLRAVWNRTAERRSRIPLDVALYVVREIARGLDYAHNYGGLGLVHRDIAPPNILISFHGEVKVTDFGLARSILKNERTAPGIVYGRIAYLAPEQARGEQADARTDIFATGVILWELLTGRPLHDTGDDAVKNLDQARHPRVESPSHLTRGLPSSIDAVSLKALATEREQRYQTAEEFRKAIADELARIAPGTDSSRVAAFLKDLFGDEAKREAAERERLLREELPKLRASRSGTERVLQRLPERSENRQSERPASDDPPTRPAIPALMRDPAATLDINDSLDEDPATRRVHRAPALIAARQGRAAAAARRAPGQRWRARPLPGMRPTPPPQAGNRPPSPPPIRSMLRNVDRRGRRRRAHRDPSAARRGVHPRWPGAQRGARAGAGAGAGAPGVRRSAGAGAARRHHRRRALSHRARARHRRHGRRVRGRARRDRQEGRAQGPASAVLAAGRSGGALSPRGARSVQGGPSQHRRRHRLGHRRPRATSTSSWSASTGSTSARCCVTSGASRPIGSSPSARRCAARCRRRTRPASSTAISKPENIFLVSREGVPDFVKVLDFGIAKQDMGNQNSPRRLTTPGIAMGTPEYMAPEQAAGKAIDGRVDIYSVGAILYEMLTADPPHHGANVMEILAKKATESPTPPRELNPDVPEQLEEVVMRCLERDPDRRPQTMGALEYELTKSMKGRGSAVAAVLGLKPSDDVMSSTWGEESSKPRLFETGQIQGRRASLPSIPVQRTGTTGALPLSADEDKIRVNTRACPRATPSPRR